jgi:hypothetical protein
VGKSVAEDDGAAAVHEAETAWPLLTAYLELAERHAALLVERLDGALARAKAGQAVRIDAEVSAIMANVEAVINALPPVDICRELQSFKS